MNLHIAYKLKTCSNLNDGKLRGRENIVSANDLIIW